MVPKPSLFEFPDGSLQQLDCSHAVLQVPAGSAAWLPHQALESPRQPQFLGLARRCSAERAPEKRRAAVRGANERPGEATFTPFYYGGRGATVKFRSKNLQWNSFIVSCVEALE